VDWKKIIINLFGSDIVLNPKALSGFVNRIWETISRTDKWLLRQLSTVDTSNDILELPTKVKQHVDTTGYFDLHASLQFYSNDAKMKITLHDKKLLKKHAKFWEYVFNQERVNKYGFDITLRPLYNIRVKPAIEQIRVQSKKSVQKKEKQSTRIKQQGSIITGITAGILTLISNHNTYKILKNDYNTNDKREDNRTIKVIGLSELKIEFHIDYQHITGDSETKKTEGEVDFAIFDKEKNTKVTIGEAINWSGYDKNLINHINKLQENYNPTRLPFLMFLIYYEGETERFQEKYEYYIEKYETDKLLEYPCIGISDITEKYTKDDVIRIAESKHKYSNQSGFTIFHFFIDFSEKNTESTVKN